jgi:hypothetical protein
MTESLRRLARRWWVVGLGVGVVGLLLPLLGGRLLPFHDASGIIGLGGALALRDDPVARVRELYDIDIRAYPSSLYFGWAWLAGAVGAPMDIAFTVFTALFSLLGPLAATALLLSAFGRPLYLALLVLPVSYHHQVWFGFLGSSAAITGILLALAFARRVVDRPTPGNHLGLAGALLFVASAHPFPLALTLAAVAPLLVWPALAIASPGVDRRVRLARLALRLATLLPMVLFLLGWVSSFFGGRTGDVSFLRRVMAEVRLTLPSLSDGPQFLKWLGNGYETGWDELAPAAGLLSVLAFLIFGARPGTDASAEAPPGRAAAPSGRSVAPPEPAAAGTSLAAGSLRSALGRWYRGIDPLVLAGLAWPAVVFGAGYLFLPMKLMWPDFWWGVRVRCVVPFYLVLVALVPVRRRGLPGWAAAPALVAGLAMFGYIAYDFSSYWRGRVLVGFEQALAAIPPGRSVLVFPDLPDAHYTEGHPYLPQVYVARKGGRVVPYLGGHPGAYWITMKEPPPSPPWGDPRAFDWERHGRGYDYFLHELPVDGVAVDPMRFVPPGAVGVVSAQGQWVLYQRLPGGEGTAR